MQPSEGSTIAPETATSVGVRLPHPKLSGRSVAIAINDIAMKHDGIKGETHTVVRGTDISCYGAVEFSPAAQAELKAIMDSFTVQARELINNPELPPVQIQFYNGDKKL